MQDVNCESSTGAMQDVDCVFIENICIDEQSDEWNSNKIRNLIEKANNKVESETVEGAPTQTPFLETRKIKEIFPASIIIAREKIIQKRIESLESIFDGNDIPAMTQFIILRDNNYSNDQTTLGGESVRNNVENKLGVEPRLATTTGDVVRKVKFHLKYFNPSSKQGRKNIRNYGEDINSLFKDTSQKYDVVPDEIKDEDEEGSEE